MQIAINKTKTAAVITIALLMASVALMAMPVQAQTTLPPGVVPTNLQSQGSIPLPSGVTPDVTCQETAYVGVSPNPIGINQPLLVNMWLCPGSSQYHYVTSFYVTFTKPDGSTDKVGPLNSYPADLTAWFNYVVDQVGTWSYKFDFLGGYFPAGNYSIPLGAWAGNNTISYPKSLYYTPSSDGPHTFVVQQEQVSSWPASPLPTDYWTRPISIQNREWWPIAGYFPGTGVVGGIGFELPIPSSYQWPAGTNTYMSNYGYTPYVTGPTSAHILWARQGNIGGLLGGQASQYSLSGGGGNPSIVFQGRCYQTVTKPMLTLVNGTYINIATSVWQCYDLRTGAIYWEQTGVPAATFVTYEAPTPEVTGAAIGIGGGQYLATISGGRLIKYNPYTGAVSQNISIAPLTTGTFYMQSDYAYFLTVQNLGTTVPIAQRYRLINWTAHGVSGGGGSTVNITLRVMNNITWPFSSLGTVDYEVGIAATTFSAAGSIESQAGASAMVWLEAASITTGQLLWNVSTGQYGGGGTALADHGKIVGQYEKGVFRCWDLTTGKFLWKSEVTDWPWQCWFCYSQQSYGGMIIENTYAGVAAYSWDTGKLVWMFKDPNAYAFETPYGGYESFFTTNFAIANGIDYAFEGEHTTTQPVTRSWKIVAINTTDGTAIWNMTGSMAPGAVADGYLTASNSYDGYMYVFGKGTSATTVTAPDTAVPKGTAVLIHGTVFDTSPGIQAATTAPAGSPPPLQKNRIGLQNVPCVSDASMKTQMDYLYMQLPIKGVSGTETMTGVPVILTAIGSDGTVIDIGTTTTNAYYGTFNYAWTPPKEDTYTIMASFAGTDSYGSSSAATGLVVSPAPTVTPTPTAQPQVAPDNTGLIYATLAAVIVAIIIGIIAILVGLRKRQ